MIITIINSGDPLVDLEFMHAKGGHQCHCPRVAATSATAQVWRPPCHCSRVAATSATAQMWRPPVPLLTCGDTIAAFVLIFHCIIQFAIIILICIDDFGRIKVLVIIGNDIY